MSDLIVEVCKISAIEKHPNADRLSIATIKGWSCIVGLDEYKSGDLVIFCPPDSVIPIDLVEKYKLEYLRKDGRVKTVRLRKAISQGLVLSIPEIGRDWREGLNVASILGITKYEPPVNKNLQAGQQPTRKKRNPLFDKYTNINNIKNYNRAFRNGELVVITEKIHGTNFRAGNLKRYGKGFWNRIKAFFFGEYEFVYGSHNVQITGHRGRNSFYGEDVYGRIAKKYNLKEIIPEDYIVYGEIYGKGIQELHYGLESDIDVRFFGVKYKGVYLDWEETKVFLVGSGLPIVPILFEGDMHKGIIDESTQGLSALAAINGDNNQIKEGCVVKTVKEGRYLLIGRKILKSINPEYLLKKDRTEHH